MTTANAKGKSKVPIIATSEEVNSLLKDAGKKVVFIEFFAEWCGPCKLIDAMLDQMCEDYKDTAVFCKIDVDQMEEYATKMGVAMMPTVLYMQNMNKLQLLGGSDIDKIKNTLNKYVNPDKDAIKTVKESC